MSATHADFIDPSRLASRRRRLAAGLYDALLLGALLFIASYVFVSFARDASSGWLRHLHQSCLLAVVAAYVIYCDAHGGQTLGMKTWKIALCKVDGKALEWKQALYRFPLAALGWMSTVSLVWSIFDREHLFLHDRLAATRVIMVEQPAQALRSGVSES